MEDFLCYIYSNRLFESLVSVNGDEIQIVHPGIRNIDGNPSFFNAKLRINDIPVTGNICVVKSSSDISFSGNNVVLYVVLDNDVLFDDTSVRVAVMKPLKNVYDTYFDLKKFEGCNNEIPCRKWMFAIPNIVKKDWMTALFVNYCCNEKDKTTKYIKKKKGLLKCKCLADMMDLYNDCFKKVDAKWRYIVFKAIPAMVAFGIELNDDNICENAYRCADQASEVIEYLSSDASAKFGIKTDSVVKWIAVVELENNYCSKKKCERCRLGCYIFRNADSIRSKINGKL